MCLFMHVCMHLEMCFFYFYKSNKWIKSSQNFFLDTLGGLNLGIIRSMYDKWIMCSSGFETIRRMLWSTFMSNNTFVVHNVNILKDTASCVFKIFLCLGAITAIKEFLGQVHRVNFPGKILSYLSTKGVKTNIRCHSLYIEANRMLYFIWIFSS